MFTYLILLFFMWCFLSALLVTIIVISGSNRSNPLKKTLITPNSSASSLRNVEDITKGMKQVDPSSKPIEIELIEYIS